MVTGYESCSCRTEERSRREDACSRCGQGITALVSILGGIIFAIAGVLLFNASLLPEIGVIVWAVLITALVYLFVLIGISASDNAAERARCCVKKYLAVLLIGIFGAVFSSLVALAAGLTVGAVLSIILVALVFFFFAYMVISALFLIRCSAE